MLHMTTLPMLVLGAIIAGCGGTAAGAEPLAVRVTCSNGVPQLTLNGRAVRARMFLGVDSSVVQPVTLTMSGRMEALEFIATQNAPATATIHFRFGQAPGDIFLDDIEVLDLDARKQVLPRCDFERGTASLTSDWVVWPPPPQNTVGVVTIDPGAGRDQTRVLHVSIKAPTAGPWPDFHIAYLRANLEIVQGHHYRVRFWARSNTARPLSVAIYRAGEVYTLLSGRSSVFPLQVQMAAQAGVNFITVPIAFPWPAPGQAADWASVDSQVKGVLAANPRALLIPRVSVDPPAWWYLANPGDAMKWEDGPHSQGVVAASPQYRKDASQRLTAFVTHLEDRFGDHIAGYHPCGHNTGEWFYQDSWNHALNGYAQGDRDAWRAWLKQRYMTDSALQLAWADPAATLELAAVPTPGARHAAPTGVLRQGAAARNLVDFAQFQQEAMADCVAALAHAVRMASGGRKLVVFFYGYGFELAAVHNGPATSGHYALGRVLRSPDIDVLCAPISYFDRGPGQSGPAMAAAESVALAGKLWLCEDDTRTYLCGVQPPGEPQPLATLEQSRGVLARNVSQAAMRNFGTWWMDLFGMGWFNDAALWTDMARLKPVDEQLLACPTPFAPQVAAVLDESSMFHVAAGGDAVTGPGLSAVRQALGRMGAPYGQYLLDDVLADKVHAKLYVMLNAWSLSPERRAKLAASLGDSARIWCYAPGYLDEQGVPSPAAMCELTGFRIEKVAPAEALATPTPAGRALGLQQALGVACKLEPLFAAADATPQETLAVYPDGLAAIAWRRVGRHWSLFVGVPGLNAPLLRLAADHAAVHLYTRVDCNVYANGPFVAVHAAADGPLELDTGNDAALVDAISGKALGRGPRLTLQLQAGQTTLLREARGEPRVR